jgi:hypothetical protein
MVVLTTLLQNLVDKIKSSTTDAKQKVTEINFRSLPTLVFFTIAPTFPFPATRKIEEYT